MRTISYAALAALSANVVSPVYLVALGFTSGIKYMGTQLGTIAWNGNDFEGQGDLLGVSSIPQSSALEAEGITISLSGIPVGNISSAIGDVATYLPVNVWLALMANNAIIADPIPVFSGHVDVPTIQDSGDKIDISISCENDLLGLTRASMLRYDDATQRISYPTDTGFLYVVAVASWSGLWGGKNSGNTIGAPGDNSFF